MCERAGVETAALWCVDVSLLPPPPPPWGFGRVELYSEKVQPPEGDAPKNLKLGHAPEKESPSLLWHIGYAPLTETPPAFPLVES